MSQIGQAIKENKQNRVHSHMNLHRRVISRVHGLKSSVSAKVMQHCPPLTNYSTADAPAHPHLWEKWYLQFYYMSCVLYISNTIATQCWQCTCIVGRFDVFLLKWHFRIFLLVRPGLELFWQTPNLQSTGYLSIYSYIVAVFMYPSSLN